MSPPEPYVCAPAAHLNGPGLEYSYALPVIDDVRSADEIEPPVPPVPKSPILELLPATPEFPVSVAPKKRIPALECAPPLPPFCVAEVPLGLDLAPPPLPPVR